MVADTQTLAHGNVCSCGRRHYRQGRQAHSLFDVQFEGTCSAETEPMSETREWPRIAVVGAGAVGGYFGGMFARAGAPTVFIGRKHFAEAVNSKGLVLEKLHGHERIRAKATVDMSAVRDCPLILFSVKANDTL